ncbi:MAG: hypothetical protein Q9204_004903 [Flavoplaca sp. TL-2023a]
MEAAGLAVGILSLYNAAIDILDRVDTYKKFGAESQISLVHFEAAKVRLQDWADRVGIRKGKMTNFEAKRAVIVKSALESLKILLDEVEHTSSSFKLPVRRPTANTILPGETREKPEHHQASKRSRLNWAMGGKEKLNKNVAVLEGLVNVLYQVATPGEASASHWLNSPLKDDEAPLTASEAALKSIQESLIVLDRRDIIEWLDALKYDDEQEKHISLHLSGTSEWIIRHPSFINWESDQATDTGAKFLWIHGPAGFGKTVLSAWLNRYIRDTLNLPVACCFSSSHAQRIEDFDGIVRTWVTHLAQDSIEVLDQCQAARREHSGRRASRAVIWSLLKRILQQLPSCILALDGLDEFPDINETRSRFLDNLKNAVASTKVRILITSRNEPDIEAQLRPSATKLDKYTILECTLSKEDVKSDLGLYSQAVVAQKFSRQDETYREDLSAQLAERADGMFLWIKLQQSQLRGSQSRKTVQRIVEAMPHGLDQTYEQNWKSIQSLAEPDRVRAIDILRWLTFGTRPLRVEELIEALVIELDEHHEVFCEDDLPPDIDDDYINQEIKGLCRSFIDVRDAEEDAPCGMNTVHLAHVSVREYLVTVLPVPLMSGTSPLQDNRVAAHHAMLATYCLEFLNHAGAWDIGEEGMYRSFTIYAACSWFTHIRKCLVDDQYYDGVSDLLHNFLSSENPYFKSWHYFGVDLDSNEDEGDKQDNDAGNDGQQNNDGVEGAISEVKPSATYYACLFELYPSIDFLLNNKHEDFNTVGGSAGTPLQLACLQGIYPVFERLMRCGADTTVLGGPFRTAMNAAAQAGHYGMVKSLLRREDSTAQSRSRILEAVNTAARYGYLEILELLLDEGPFALSSRESDEEKMKCLSDSLYEASYHGYLLTVKSLLDRGANIDHRSQFYARTPLHGAIRNNQCEVVGELVGRGADVAVRDKEGRSPLHLAAFTGHMDIAACLLSHGADVDAEVEIGPNAGYGALDIALNGCHLGLVNQLLDQNAEVDAMVGPMGLRTIHQAALKGFVDIVQRLIRKGADVNAQSKNKSTPLFYALVSGYYAAAECLLHHGADPNAQNEHGDTPLCAVSNSQHGGDDQDRRAVAQLLCDHGAEPNIENDSGETPLQLAIGNGLEEVIVELLRRGASLLATDKYGMTCLDRIKRLQPRMLKSEALKQKVSDVAIKVDQITLRRNAYEHIKRVAFMLKADQMPTTTYYQFCTMLLLLDMDHDASLAYQLNYLHGRSHSDDRGGGAVCDGCRARQTRENPFYKCKTCPNTDFCHECMTTFEEMPIRKFCEGHEFIRAVPSEARILPDQTEALQDWLLGIEERLKAGDLEVESDHTPETVPG